MCLWGAVLLAVVFAAELRPVAVVSSTPTEPGRSAALLADGRLDTFARFLDSTPGKRPVTASFVLDLGKEFATVGLRLVSQAERWVSTSPFQIRVSACDDASGTNGVRELACDLRLHPALACESQFLSWPRTASRRYRVDVEEAGYPGVLSYGEYCTWGDWHCRDAFGLPRNGYGEPGVVDFAEVRLLAERSEDLPAWNAFPDRAYPTCRLEKDWTLQDAGFEGFAVLLSTRSGSYLETCRQRRRMRLAKLVRETPRFVYVKHYTISGDAELSGNAMVSDERHPGKPRCFRPGGQLCLATVREDGSVAHEVLVDRPRGCVRDPDVSFDGKRVLFAMRNDFKTDDYHLYTLDLEMRYLTQLTFSDPAPCADFEGCWLSDGRIAFQSTRCEQIIPCHINENSNLYVCDGDGRNIRRLGYDGGSTFSPQELPDGRILYTRYEYNDRNARFQQPLFTMNPDGTMQTELYGNSSWFPTSLIHFRPIPGTRRLLGIVSGHHVGQRGKLVVPDTEAGNQGNEGLSFVAGADIDGRPGVVRSHYGKGHPVYDKARAASDPVIDDFAAMHGAQWQYPYPLSEQEWLVAFCPEGFVCGTKCGDHPNFGVYWQNAKGERELLAYDPEIGCAQPVPVRERKTVARRRLANDPGKAFAVCYVQNVYEGQSTAGVKPGTVKTLRVVALENRPAFIRKGSMCAPHDACFNALIPYEGDISGEALTVPGGAWDVKHVLGEVDVAPEGSCAFEVPACTPVYFQLLDARGCCVQTMRSWTTQMPGELNSCIGCHERKRDASAPGSGFATKVQRLRPAPGQPAHPLLERLRQGGRFANVGNFLGVHAAKGSDPEAKTEGFSYRRLVQPILDRRCVRCHDGHQEGRPNLTGTPVKDRRLAFEKPGWKTLVDAGRAFTESYFSLTGKGHQTPRLNWYSSTGVSSLLPPYAMGSARSTLMDNFTAKHHGVDATDEERRVVACWIDLGVPFGGSYAEATLWTAKERELFDYHERKREAFAAKELQSERCRCR